LNNNAPSTRARLRRAAEEQAARFPPLLAEAQHLALSITHGSHGRRQEGMGDEFWQYRPAQPGDQRGRIDWRRSARGDVHFIRQHEWQAAQSVLMWVDDGLSMRFSGDPNARPTKHDRASVLALSLAILLLRGGERVGMMQDGTPPRTGRTQIERLLVQMTGPQPEHDHARLMPRPLPRGARVVMFSDFLGDLDEVESTLQRAADQGAGGALVQVLDPVEESFPYDGRTRFHSMSGKVKFETLRARGLRQAYLEKLAARKDRLGTIARHAGWRYVCHHTDASAQQALMWLISGFRRGR